MPANDALLASLLLGQRQRRDPLEVYQSFGKQQMQAGSSTTPLGSGNALEGIARALQGGIGGLVQGYALGKQTEQDDALNAGLSKASTAGSPEGIAAALQGLKGSEANGVLGQIVQGRLDKLLTQQQAGTQLGPLLGSMPGAAPPAAPMQQGGGASPAGGINTTALAPPGATQGGFANNSGNIRSTAPGNVNGFATYATPEDGAKAHFANYQAYVQQNPNITVAQALAKWSPPTENNTNGIVSQLSEATGINPGMPLAEVLKDPAMAAQLLDAQTRLEKGGLPQGFNANTFLAATGGGQASPGNPGQIAAGPQIAQGSGPTPASPQGAPTAMSSPAGDQLRQRAQASAQSGDNVTALKYAQEAAQEDAKWASKVGEINVNQSYEDTKYARAKADEEARHQRDQQEKKANPTYTQEQNLAHTYTTRLNNAIPQLEALAQNPETIPSWSEQMRANSSYAPEFTVSDKAKEFRRITKDIMSSTLRRESGASISDSEYTSEAQKFIPQPGDPPDVIKNKLAALRQAGRSIAEGTGRPVETYSAIGGMPAAGSGAGAALGGGSGPPPPPPGFRPIR